MRTQRWQLFVILFACFASAILGDSAAEALLLARFGPDLVPWLFLANAFFLFVCSGSIMSVIDRADRGLVFLRFVIIHGVMLLVVRVCVAAGATFLFLPLFSYAYVSKILLFLLFWTLANDLIDSREAGRTFPFVAAGGTLGAIAISFSIPWLLRVISAENLLVVWSVVVFGLAALFVPVRRACGRSFRPSSDRQKHLARTFRTRIEDVRLLKTEPLLANMSLLYFLLFFVICNQHYAFYGGLKQYFAESGNQARDMAAFLGYFNGISMVTTFLLQLTVSGRVIRKIGSTRSMFLLPAALCLVFGATLLLRLPALAGSGSAAVFWAITMGVGVRIACFDSFFSPNFQVFFSSLPQSMRGRGKLLIEGVVKPVAMLTAGLWLAWGVGYVPFFGQLILLLVLSLALVYQTFHLRDTYTENLTRYLSGFDRKSTQWLRSIVNMPDEKPVLEYLSNILRGDHSGLKNYVIEILAQMRTPEAVKLLKRQLQGSDTVDRAMVVAALGRTGDRSMRGMLLVALDDDDPRVAANAVEALSHGLDRAEAGMLWPLLRSPSGRIRANVVIALWPRAEPEERTRLTAELDAMLGSERRDDIAGGLYAMGVVRPDGLVARMKKFSDERSDCLENDRELWRDYLCALGASGDPAAAAEILSSAGDCTRKDRLMLAHALESLFAHGDIVSRVTSEMAGMDYLRRHVVLRSLYGARVEPGRELEGRLRETALDESERARRDRAAIRCLNRVSRNPGVVLLRDAIEEECFGERVGSVLYVASLLDRGGRVRKAAHRLFHANRHVRARAIEVLDNAGDQKTNRLAVELLESRDALEESGGARRGSAIEPEEVLREYRTCAGAWVRTCCDYAAYCMGPAS